MNTKILFVLPLFFLVSSLSFADGQDFRKADWNCDSLSHGARIAVDSVGKNLWRVPLDHAGNPIASEAKEYIVDDFKVYRCQGCFDIVAHAPKSMSKSNSYRFVMRGKLFHGRERYTMDVMRAFGPPRALFHATCSRD